MEKKGCILHGEGDLAPAGWSMASPGSGFLDKEAYCEAGTSTPTREFLRGGKEQELGSK